MATGVATTVVLLAPDEADDDGDGEAADGAGDVDDVGSGVAVARRGAVGRRGR